MVEKNFGKAIEKYKKSLVYLNVTPDDEPEKEEEESEDEEEPVKNEGGCCSASGHVIFIRTFKITFFY